MYAKNPKTPNKNEEAASPMNPPIPKWLIIRNMQIAKDDNMIISSRKKSCWFCVLFLLSFVVAFFVCFDFVFRFPVFFDVAMKIPLVS
jgi:hypothetical protein